MVHKPGYGLGTKEGCDAWTVSKPIHSGKSVGVLLLIRVMSQKKITQLTVSIGGDAEGWIAFFEGVGKMYRGRNGLL